MILVTDYSFGGSVWILFGIGFTHVFVYNEEKEFGTKRFFLEIVKGNYKFIPYSFFYYDTIQIGQVFVLKSLQMSAFIISSAFWYLNVRKYVKEKDCWEKKQTKLTLPQRMHEASSTFTEKNSPIKNWYIQNFQESYPCLAAKYCSAISWWLETSQFAYNMVTRDTSISFMWEGFQEQFHWRTILRVLQKTVSETLHKNPRHPKWSLKNFLFF